MRRLLAAFLLFSLWAAPARAANPADALAWQPWGNATFERALDEQRYIILNLHAAWCHWCHVMDETTYADPRVRAAIAEKFIPVLVDQDSNPELSYRYERFGWPATVMFDGDGNEILVRRGYVDPDTFLELLRIVIEDPSALPNLSATPEGDPDVVQLDEDARAVLRRLYFELYDDENGGFGRIHRFIQADALEWALENGRHGQDRHAGIWRKTLANARHLIDPEWGGMYQYSDQLDWLSPHFEKIMNIQLAAIRVYSLAYLQSGEQRWLAAARDVHRWLEAQMMSDEGAFYTSQDADLSREVDGKQFFILAAAEREKLGRPRIDTAIYARENGWVIQALAHLADATGEARYLDQAVRAASWVIANRQTAAGGFGHGEADEAQSYLADNLAMAEAFLALYRTTGARDWLRRAEASGRYIARQFAAEPAGFMAKKPAEDARGALKNPVKQLEENVAATRFFNLLWRYSGDPLFRRMNEHGLAHLIAYAEYEIFLPGLQLAEREARFEPAHITIVGRRGDPAAQALFDRARRYPTRYLRIDWWDRREGPLPNPDVTYPELEQAAAFACANGLCSLPVLDPDKLFEAVRRVEPQHGS